MRVWVASKRCRKKVLLPAPGRPTRTTTSGESALTAWPDRPSRRRARRWEMPGARAVPARALDGGVRQLLAGAGAAEQHGAPAHVAAAHEVGREQQVVAEHARQRLDVFVAGHAAQQHEAGGGAVGALEGHRVLDQRLGEAAVAGVDGDLGPGPQPVEGERLVQEAQAFAGADDQAAGQPGRRAAEALGVGHLAPEIEAADEAEERAQRARRPASGAARARSNCAFGLKTSAARSPPRLQGDSRKIVKGGRVRCRSGKVSRRCAPRRPRYPGDFGVEQLIVHDRGATS